MKGFEAGEYNEEGEVAEAGRFRVRQAVAEPVGDGGHDGGYSSLHVFVDLKEWVLHIQMRYLGLRFYLLLDPAWRHSLDCEYGGAIGA